MFEGLLQSAILGTIVKAHDREWLLIHHLGIAADGRGMYLAIDASSNLPSPAMMILVDATTDPTQVSIRPKPGA